MVICEFAISLASGYANGQKIFNYQTVAFALRGSQFRRYDRRCDRRQGPIRRTQPLPEKSPLLAIDDDRKTSRTALEKTATAVTGHAERAEGGVGMRAPLSGAVLSAIPCCNCRYVSILASPASSRRPRLSARVHARDPPTQFAKDFRNGLAGIDHLETVGLYHGIQCPD